MILDVEQHRTRFVSRFHLSSRKKHRSRLVKMDDFWHGSPSMHPFPPSLPFSFAFFAFVRFFSSFFNATPRFILLTALFLPFSCVSYFFIFFFSFFFLFFCCVLCSFLSFLSVCRRKIGFSGFLRFPRFQVYVFWYCLRECASVIIKIKNFIIMFLWEFKVSTIRVFRLLLSDFRRVIGKRYGSVMFREVMQRCGWLLKGIMR